jgi:hypothetical protein
LNFIVVRTLDFWNARRSRRRRWIGDSHYSLTLPEIAPDHRGIDHRGYLVIAALRPESWSLKRNAASLIWLSGFSAQ